MSIYRKTIDFPEEYRDKMRRVANAHPETFKSEQGHLASVNALIIKAVDIFLEPLLTQLNKQHPTPTPDASPALEPVPAAPVRVPFVKAPSVDSPLLAVHNWAYVFGRIDLVARMSEVGEAHGYLTYNGVQTDRNLILTAHPDTERLRIEFPGKDESWIEVPLSAFYELLSLARSVYGDGYTIGYLEANPALATAYHQTPTLTVLRDAPNPDLCPTCGAERFSSECHAYVDDVTDVYPTLPAA